MQTFFQDETVHLAGEPRGQGAYDVYAMPPVRGPAGVASNSARVRIGLISGHAGNWSAEDAKGRPLSCFNTRMDAARML